jgi:hypothetical protein
MDTRESLNDAVSDESASSMPAPHETEAGAKAWELIETGRYRPRRIRGSLRGRELG